MWNATERKHNKLKLKTGRKKKRETQNSEMATEDENCLSKIWRWQSQVSLRFSNGFLSERCKTCTEALLETCGEAGNTFMLLPTLTGKHLTSKNQPSQSAVIPLWMKGRSDSSSVTYSTTLLTISNIVTLEKVQYTHTVTLCSRNTGIWQMWYFTIWIFFFFLKEIVLYKVL